MTLEQQEPIEPVTPERVEQLRKSSIPPEVLVAFNELITENYRDGLSTVLQKDVLAKIVKLTKTPADRVIALGWLDVEDVYRQCGWDVTYDKPGFNESGEAFFKFVKKGP